jgi:hypothetical protein
VAHRSWSARLALALVPTLVLAATGSPAYADAPEGWPTDVWPVCADASAQYCVEEATLTPVGGVPTGLGELGLTAAVSTLDGGNGVLSFNWSVEGLDGDAVPATVRGGDVRLVIRVGQFHPRYTMALAKGFRIQRATDEADNVTMTMTGRPVHVDWVFGNLYGPCASGVSCGDENTMGDVGGYRFSGNTQDLETWGAPYTTILDGTYIATNAEARPTVVQLVTWPTPSWYLSALGNPHLDAAGNAVRGSFNAWIPPAYFESLGTTAEAAAAVGLDVVSSEGGSSVSVPASVTARDGGVALDVPDFGYSVHRVDVFNRASTATVGATAPGRPRALTVGQVTGGLATYWSPPTTTGGLPIGSYVVRAFTAASGGTVVGSCTTATTSCAFTGLTPGTTYHLAVSAVNALGEGPATAVRVAGTPTVAPSAPRSVRVTTGAGTLAATWTAPVSIGASAITSYTARAYLVSSGSTSVRYCTSTPAARACTLTGLTNGTRYYVSVSATNSDGVGAASSPRVSGVPRTIPGAPQAVTARAGATTLAMSWAAPASTGGSAITGYTVRAYRYASGGTAVRTCLGTPTGRSCTLTGLSRNTRFYVTVTATNVAGAGPASARLAASTLA